MCRKATADFGIRGLARSFPWLLFAAIPRFSCPSVTLYDLCGSTNKKRRPNTGTHKKRSLICSLCGLLREGYSMKTQYAVALALVTGIGFGALAVRGLYAQAK